MREGRGGLRVGRKRRDAVSACGKMMGRPSVAAGDLVVPIFVRAVCSIPHRPDDGSGSPFRELVTRQQKTTLFPIMDEVDS